MRTHLRRYTMAFILLISCQVSCALFSSSGLQRAKGYSVFPHKNWVVEQRAESDSAFRTTYGNIVTLTSSCERDSRAPLELLTKHLLMGTRDVVYTQRTRHSINGNEGMHSSVVGVLNGISIYMELFVVTAKNCIFDFSLLGKKALSTEEVEEFKTFVRSLTFEEPS